MIVGTSSLKLQTLCAVLVMCLRINAFRLKVYHKFSATLILFVTTLEVSQSTNIVGTRLTRDHSAAKAAQVIRSHKTDRRSSTNRGSYDLVPG